MNNIEYNWIKAHHELAGEVMVRQRSKGSSDLDFTKVEQ